MPTYDYSCQKCGDYEIVRSITTYDGKDPCPTCSTIGGRIFSRNGMFMGAAVQSAEWNPGLGCVVKNDKHRAQICKEKGLIEIGSEKPETLRKMENERKKKLDKPYLTGNELWKIKDSMR